jgi:hypothetical protein
MGRICKPYTAHACSQCSGFDRKDVTAAEAKGKCRHCLRACISCCFRALSSGDPTCPLGEDIGGKRAVCFVLAHVEANHYRFWRNTMSTQDTAMKTASELGKEAKESVEELGRSAGRKMDAVRGETGAALHTAACSVRGAGAEGSGAIDDLATGTADQLDAAASFVENHDLKDVFTSLRMYAHRHLTGSLVAAAVVGIFAGSALRRATHKCGKAAEGTQL